MQCCLCFVSTWTISSKTWAKVNFIEKNSTRTSSNICRLELSSFIFYYIILYFVCCCFGNLACTQNRQYLIPPSCTSRDPSARFGSIWFSSHKVRNLPKDWKDLMHIHVLPWVRNSSSVKWFGFLISTFHSLQEVADAWYKRKGRRSADEIWTVISLHTQSLLVDLIVL